MAAHIGGLTRDDDLGGDVDIGPSSATGDLNAIGESAGGGVGPAGTAILGDVLVADVGQEVGAVDVVPEDLLGEVVGWDKWSLDLGCGAVDATFVAWVLGVDIAGSAKSDNTQKSRDCESFHDNFFMIIK